MPNGLFELCNIGGAGTGLSYRWVQAEQRTNGRGRCYSKIRHPQPLLFRPLRFVASDQPRRDCSRRSSRVSSGKDLPKKGNWRRVSVHHAVNRPWGLRGRPPSGPSAGVVHKAINRPLQETAPARGGLGPKSRRTAEGGVRHNSDVVSQSAETIKFRFRIRERPILNLRVSKRNGLS